MPFGSAESCCGMVLDVLSRSRKGRVMKRVTGSVLVVLMLSAVLLVGGCATKAQTGAGVGAGAGALAGQAIGGDTKSTLIGAGAGAIGGYMIGNEMDKADGY